MKRKYYPIPFTQLPEGIKLSIKNCERYYSESIVLEKYGHYASATVSILIAIEEFSKGVFLLEYYKMKKDVPKNKVEEIFSKHKIRLAKFHELFYKSLPSSSYDVRLTQFSKSMGDSDQFKKLNLMYVDWKKHYWLDPLKSLGVGLNHEDVWINMYSKSNYDSLKSDLEIVFSIIRKDDDYIKVISTMDIDNISIPKLKDMIKKQYGENIPTRLSFTPDKDQITIEIKPIKKEINEENNKKLRKKIEDRFKGFSVEIKFDESN